MIELIYFVSGGVFTLTVFIVGTRLGPKPVAVVPPKPLKKTKPVFKFPGIKMPPKDVSGVIEAYSPDDLVFDKQEGLIRKQFELLGDPEDFKE